MTSQTANDVDKDNQVNIDAYPYNLGSYTREALTASNASARAWFQRGLAWTYAYHHEEAVTCFRRALQHDAKCILAYWGVAYAIGPNYNKPWEAFEEDEKPNALATARQAVAAAWKLIQDNDDDDDDDDTVLKYSPVEIDLVRAIQKRYPAQPQSADDTCSWNDDFYHAMQVVHQTYSDDLDVCAIFVESILNRTPWKLWDLSTGQPAHGAYTEEALRVLERAFAEKNSKAWDHFGLLHMHVHLMEMSPTPEQALRHGDALFALAQDTDAGHLLHMPTHLDVLCGNYATVVARNQAAVVADRKYRQNAGADNFYTLYRCHNLHFVVYGALFAGQLTPALQAADEIVSSLPETLLRKLPDWLESFVPLKQHVWIRFGRWSDILDQALPEDKDLYCVTMATMRYARAVALANMRDGKSSSYRITEAETERTLFRQALAAVPASRMLFNNAACDILKVAEQMMDGEVEFRKGNYDVAFDHLRKAVALDDNLPYDEPWGWMQPVRHALGALLLERGRYEEAEAVYRADLGLDATLARACQHPGNVWSLHGLMECLKHRGEKVESPHIQQQLDKALAQAEVPIRASCLCRQNNATPV
eukprot:scaffold464_cov181-Amphora_coffeaeformis.AAC.20